jgi:hypothetical protein
LLKAISEVSEAEKKKDKTAKAAKTMAAGMDKMICI